MSTVDLNAVKSHRDMFPARVSNQLLIISYDSATLRSLQADAAWFVCAASERLLTSSSLCVQESSCSTLLVTFYAMLGVVVIFWYLGK